MTTTNNLTTQAEPRRARLSGVAQFAPWVQAPKTSLPDLFLFWFPVSGFPIRYDESVWLLDFFERFTAAITAPGTLRCEHFMRQKEIRGPLHNAFHAYKDRCVVYPGLGRSLGGGGTLFPPDGAPPATPAGTDEQERVGEGLLWFANKQPAVQRQLFLGHAGFIALFLPPDPKPKLVPQLMPASPAMRAAHPALQRFDVDQIVSGTAARLDPFLNRSKELFGSDLAQRSEFRRMDFTLPLLDSAGIFAASAEARAKWFELFEVYIGESRKDKGVVLMFEKQEHADVLQEVLRTMPPLKREGRG